MIVRYIGYFDFQDSDVPRKYVVSASNKMEYIADAVNRAGYDVEIVSPSASTEPTFRWHAAQVKERTPHLKARYFATFGGTAKILRVARELWHRCSLFVYLIRHTHKNDPVVVYHSLGYDKTILWAKRIRQFRLILEVEEIYQDVKSYSSRLQKLEYTMFRNADAYIFSTELLNCKLNTQLKPSVVIYGSYAVTPCVPGKFDDGCIHVVYAGTLDPDKGGASAAVEAARYLPENYVMHVIGFGTKDQLKALRRSIGEVNATAKARVVYDGLLKGNCYLEFLQKCRIGLSTQNPEASFNATSYPSKILSYMASGLHVVSVDIEVVRRSAVGSAITYYTKQEPQAIAAAIESATGQTQCDTREIVGELDRDFVERIGSIISCE